MKGFLIILSIGLVAFFACNKSKFQTKPTIEITSVNSRVIKLGGTMQVTLKVTDKEGDVDSTLTIYKTRLNKLVRPTIRDVIVRTIPEYPNKQQVEFELNLDYQNYLVSASNPTKNPATGKLYSDTVDFKFVAKDRAGNKSDTAFLRNVVIERDSL